MRISQGLQSSHRPLLKLTLCLLACTSLAAGQTGGPGLKIQYRTHNTDSPETQVYALYQIINTGTTAVRLSSLTLRYWYTIDGAQSQTFNCDFAQVGCSNISARFVPVSRPSPSADWYVELSFSPGAGSLAPGQSSGEIQTRFHKNDWSNFDQSNDYSLDPDQQFVYEDWPKVTLYMNGVLVWGREP